MTKVKNHGGLNLIKGMQLMFLLIDHTLLAKVDEQVTSKHFRLRGRELPLTI
jgi:hypothetical protein